ncbi:MAG: formate dehydrogenase iron-sulfur subunit [bacterium]|jgi:formate dehydrogenase iron-sulfur subunit
MADHQNTFSGSEKLGSIVEKYIQEQQSLSAVESFSQKHEHLPASQKKYEKVIPLSTPKEGEQYAFDVDLDLCTGCKSCVTACHSLNGLEEEETWRSVGMIHSKEEENMSALQTITTACHHCLDPACMTGCPVKAYDKDPITGIVKHLDDQCIGCQYCILQCPYGVPQYSESKGIVRKCDMCSNRLAVGEAPACVQGCPNDAITIAIRTQSDVRQDATQYVNVASAPDQLHTYPTTQYKTKRKFPKNMDAVDAQSIVKEHAHLPLVFMLVLSQLAVGGFLAEWFLPSSIFQATISLSLGLLALVLSTTHLGRPLYAFRAFLGWRTSWLSREVITFGGFAKFGLLYTTWISREFILPYLPSGVTNLIRKQEALLQPFLSSTIILVVVFGILGVICSAMLYQTTPREFWKHPRTITKFFLTVGIGSFTISLLSQGFSNTQTNSLIAPLSLGLMSFVVIKLILEYSILKNIKEKELVTLKKVAILMSQDLKHITITRFFCGALGGIVLPLGNLLAFSHSAFALVVSIVVSFICILIGELLERYLFFATSVPPKMPGASVV